MQAAPVTDSGEHERPRSRRHEPGEKRAAHRLRWQSSTRGGDLEDEERGDERPAEERCDGRERSRQDEQLRLRLAHIDEPRGDDAEPEAEGDERRLRPEHEPEPERGQTGEQDAREVVGLDRVHPEPLERRVPAVAGETQRQRHEHAGERRYEDDVPRGGLAPPEPVGHDLPHEVDDVVERRLEEHGGHGDRNPEQCCVDERAQVGQRALVHGGTLLRDQDHPG